MRNAQIDKGLRIEDAAERKVLEKEISLLRGERDQGRLALEASEAQITELEATLTDLTLLQAAEARVAELEKNLSEVSEELVSGKEKIQELETQLLDTAKASMSSKVAFDEGLSSMRESREEYRSTQEEKTRGREEWWEERLRSMGEEQEEELKSEREKAVEARETMAVERARAEGLREDVERLSESLKRASGLRAMVHENGDDAVATSLISEMKQVSKARDEALKECSSLEESLKEKEDALKETIEKNEELKKEIQEEQCDAMEDKRAFERRLLSAGELVEMRDKQLLILKADYARVKVRLDSLSEGTPPPSSPPPAATAGDDDDEREAREALEKENTRLKGTIKELVERSEESRVNSLTVELSLTHEKLRNSMEEKEEAGGRAALSRIDLNLTKMRHEVQLKESDELDSLQNARIEQLEKEIEDLSLGAEYKSRCEILEEELHHDKTIIEEYEAKVEETAQELAHVSQKLEELEKELAKSKVHVSDAREARDDEIEVRESLSKKKKKLEKQLATTTEELETLKAKSHEAIQGYKEEGRLRKELDKEVHRLKAVQNAEREEKRNLKSFVAYRPIFSIQDGVATRTSDKLVSMDDIDQLIPKAFQSGDLDGSWILEDVAEIKGVTMEMVEMMQKLSGKGNGPTSSGETPAFIAKEAEKLLAVLKKRDPDSTGASMEDYLTWFRNTFLQFECI